VPRQRTLLLYFGTANPSTAADSLTLGWQQAGQRESFCLRGW